MVSGTAVGSVPRVVQCLLRGHGLLRTQDKTVAACQHVLVEALGHLSAYPFEGKNEAAIREQWIYPLLDALGYGAHTLDEVLFEDQLALREPIRLLGSKRIKVDYRPTVLGRNLWLIEAKAPDLNASATSIARHLGQAWTYATHPEINVSLIVIADGRSLALYDVTRPTWDVPVLELQSSELPTRFSELAQWLGPRNVARTVRERQLAQLESTLQAELDPSVCEQLQERVRTMTAAALPVILENQRRIRSHQSEIDAEIDVSMLASAGTWGLAQQMNVPLGFSLLDVERAVSTVLNRPLLDRARELDNFRAATQWRTPSGNSWRPFWSLRALRFWTALRVRKVDGCRQVANRIIEQGLRDHLLNFPDDEVAGAAHRWEEILPHAILRALVSRDAASLQELDEHVQSTWDVERLLRSPADAHRFALSRTMLACRISWATSAQWSREQYDSETRALHKILHQSNEVLKTPGHPGSAFLQEYVLGIAYWPHINDELVSYTIIALAEKGNDIPLPSWTWPVIRQAHAWPGVVGESANVLFERNAPS